MAESGVDQEFRIAWLGRQIDAIEADLAAKREQFDPSDNDTPAATRPVPDRVVSGRTGDES